MTNHLEHKPMSMPGQLKGALAILCLQVLANGFIGFLVLDAIAERADHGASVPNAGLVYFVGYLSIVVAITLLVCVVLTPSRFAWVRPTIVAVEAIGVLSGAINLFSGQVTAFAAIALAIGVIAMLNRDDVRQWYRR